MACLFLIVMRWAHWSNILKIICCSVSLLLSLESCARTCFQPPSFHRTTGQRVGSTQPRSCLAPRTQRSTSTTTCGCTADITFRPHPTWTICWRSTSLSMLGRPSSPIHRHDRRRATATQWCRGTGSCLSLAASCLKTRARLTNSGNSIFRSESGASSITALILAWRTRTWPSATWPCSVIQRISFGPRMVPKWWWSCSVTTLRSTSVRLCTNTIRRRRPGLFPPPTECGSAVYSVTLPSTTPRATRSSSTGGTRPPLRTSSVRLLTPTILCAAPSRSSRVATSPVSCTPQCWSTASCMSTGETPTTIPRQAPEPCATRPMPCPTRSLATGE